MLSLRDLLFWHQNDLRMLIKNIFKLARHICQLTVEEKTANVLFLTAQKNHLLSKKMKKRKKNEA